MNADIPACADCGASLSHIRASRTADQRWRKECQRCGEMNYSNRSAIGNASLRHAYATQPGKRWGDAHGA